MNNRKIIALSIVAALAVGCAAVATQEEDYSARAAAVMKASFKEQGQAKLDRLDQDELQRMCSQYNGDANVPRDVADKIEKAQLATIKYPEGGFMGDWKQGERIAQSGVGKQFSDDPKTPSGANCYACHQVSKEEVSFGTIGPTLYQYAKLRGFTPDVQKYTYGKIYNPDAFAACTNMPRFGHMGILTEQQIKDVVALLMDPNSPVNK